MNVGRINLLPSAYARALRRAYGVRLATVAVAFAIVALALHAALLIPTYYYARNEGAREQVLLDSHIQKAAQGGVNDSQSRSAILQSDILSLSQLNDSPKASDAIRAIVQVAHPGIRISGLTFSAPQTSGTEASMTISGTAESRDALRQYVSALSHLPLVSRADLPISAYAKESNIPFTIALTGTFTP